MNKLTITINTTDESFFQTFCKMLSKESLENTTVVISGEELNYCPFCECEKDNCECGG